MWAAILFHTLSSHPGGDACNAVRAASPLRTAWRVRALTRCGRACSALAKAQPQHAKLRAAAMQTRGLLHEWTLQSGR